MYAIRYRPKRGAYGVFYKSLRFSHQAAIMNPQADPFQPTSPAKEAAFSASQKPKDSTSTDDLDSITQSLKKVSIKSSKSSKSASKPAAKATPKPKSRGFIPNDRNPLWRTNQGRNMNGSPFTKPPRDAIVPPSLASGGIPEPTPAYLAASAEPIRQLQQAQHLLVVIDLNGTLLFRPNKRAPSMFVARPNTARFLKYCINTFNVVIWSSARPDNVKLMCDAILDQDLKRKVVAIWGRDMFGLSSFDYGARTQCYKRLTKMWDDPEIAASHPAYQMGERWDHRNTVLVDDSPEKGRSEPFNMILIPEFFGDENEPGQILPQVHDYLNNLSTHSNVAAYLRAYPFRAALPAAAPAIQYHG
ncbi:HAD-like domain-containing protein [Rhexocercosporidium sp. MPI-PUGE-AT-0058]|nr:HAD-like domain-containing protein [Rhexocercosporidium sp. MPI-PUGE-AT-0058]